MANVFGIQREVGFSTDDDRAVWRARLKANTETTPSGCWLWRGQVNRDGYGRVRVRTNRVPRWERAHRLAYSLWVDAIPEDAMVLHSCDVRACLNPAHLFLGDGASNFEDARRKGRIQHDERGRMARTLGTSYYSGRRRRSA